jgi:hypothetical protein
VLSIEGKPAKVLDRTAMARRGRCEKKFHLLLISSNYVAYIENILNPNRSLMNRY